MVSYGIEEGWLLLHDGTNGFKLFVDVITMDQKTEPKISHYADKTHLYYELGKEWMEWKCKNIYHTSHTNLSAFLDKLKDWRASSQELTFLTQRTSGGSYTEWDGDNTSYTVCVAKDGLKGVEKISPGDGDVWIIALLILEQIGDP